MSVAFALGVCQRSASFYEHDHPAAVQQRKDVEEAVARWQSLAGGETLMAAAGEALLLTGLEDGLSSDVAKALCASLLSRSVVGLRLRAPTPRKDLDELVFCISESEKRIRAAGGVARVLADRGARAIDVFEMDLDQLLAGRAIDPAGLEPLFARALKEVLLFKSGDARRGAAVALSLERVSTPASLGGLLDELIDGAAPGVAEGPPKSPERRTGPLSGATADDLAEMCAEAFGKVTSEQSRTPEALTEAAKVLSSALVRLSPMARFKMLQKVAGRDKDAAAAIGREVQNPMLLSALAQVVMGGERDSQLASAVAGLLERLRPLERERQKLIDELDEAARRGGRPLEGLFLQELNELSQNKTFGALDLPFRQTRDTLLQWARHRQATKGQPEIVTKTFQTLREDVKLSRTTKLLCGMLESERAIVPTTMQSVRGVLTLSAQDPGLGDHGGAIILALWNRAIKDGPQSDAARQLADVAASTTGPDWCIALLRQLRGLRGQETATLLGDFIKGVVAIHQGDSFRRRLVDALHGLDRSVLRALERRVGELSPAGVQVFVVRAGRDSPQAALGTAQQALRASSIETKQAALRALAAFPVEQVLALLRRASGLDGEDQSVAVLFAQKSGAQALFTLQRTAVEALGATKTPAAVPILAELLNRVRLVGGGDFERMRGSAARALAVHNTWEALEVIDQGKRSKHKAVRLACGADA